MRRLASAAAVTALGAVTLLAPTGTAHAGVIPPITPAAPTPPTTDIGVLGFAPDRAVPGEKVTYRLTVTNRGPQAAAPYLDVSLPLGSTEATYDGRPLTGGSVRMEALEPGETKRVSVQARIGANGGGTLLGANFEISQGAYDNPVYQDTLYANNILKLRTVNETAAPDPGYHGSIQLTGRVTGGSEPGDRVRQRLVIHNTGEAKARDIALVGVVNAPSGEITEVTGLDDGRGVVTKKGLNYTLPSLDPGTYRVVTIVSQRATVGDLGGSYFAGADGAGYPELELRG
ncbi:hypothetical protein ACFVIM_17665 [Streptomyces sp. NPDC057638]|uniref:hypothetical protein n=1 Tax=Streptomyces sp. NPDC057638 TaxID=3346190 RepID=UPI0036A50CA9